jgi:hypothetical protein
MDPASQTLHPTSKTKEKIGMNPTHQTNQHMKWDLSHEKNQ